MIFTTIGIPGNGLVNEGLLRRHERYLSLTNNAKLHHGPCSANDHCALPLRAESSGVHQINVVQAQRFQELTTVPDMVHMEQLLPLQSGCVRASQVLIHSVPAQPVFPS